MQFLNVSFLFVAFFLLLLLPFVKKRALFLALFFLFVALSRPVINDGDKIIKDKNIEIVLALDISRSMQLKDIKPSRIKVAIEKLKSFCLNSEEFSMALIVFGRSSEIVVPMTKDKTLMLERISAIENFDDVEGTNYKDVIKNATLLFSTLNRHILFFTDGGDKEDTKAISKLAKKLNIKLHALTIATHKKMMLDGFWVLFNEKFKQEIIKSGGIYKEVTADNSDIEELLEELMLKASNSVIKVPKQTELFYIPALIALMIIFAKRYFVYLTILFVLFIPKPIEANFLGYIQLKLQNYDLAIKLLTPPKDDVEKYNLAFALEKVGRLEEAKKVLESINTEDKLLKKKAKYNLAMIYAKTKEYQKALLILQTLKKCCDSKKIDEKIKLIQQILKNKKQKLMKKQKAIHSNKKIVKKFIPVTLGDGEGYKGKPW